MFVETVRRPHKGKVYSAVLLRETYRQDGKVKHRTLANLSALPAATIDLIRRSLKGETLVGTHEAFNITGSVSHGAVSAVWQLAQRLKLPELLGRSRAWWPAVMAMLIARVVEPGSKRFTAEWWHTTSLPRLLGLPADFSVNALYDAMDELLLQQDAIEAKLAKRHVGAASLVLYDLSSSYLEGRYCSLAAFGHNRDGKRGKKQFTYGLLTDENGCPVSVQVFKGNMSDPLSLTPALEKLKQRFGLEHLVVVGDRGMITQTRIAELETEGYTWVTALRSGAIQQLREQGLLQLSLFDQRDLAEIHEPSRPGERLVVCRNPNVAQERKRKREQLLQATEAALLQVKQRVQSGRLKKPDAIGVAVGKVINRFKMAKHFECTIQPGQFDYCRREQQISEEAALDGIYVIRTSVPAEQMCAEQVVARYKSLKYVERAFRSMKSMQLELRPVFHRLEERVRAHVFICMLAYYLVWHLEQALAPMRQQSPEQYGSLRLVLRRLHALQLNTVTVQGQSFEKVTQPDAVQQRILEHLGITSLL